jgi:hypothetical protein
MKIIFLILLCITITYALDKKVMIKLEKENGLYRGNLEVGSQKQELAFLFSTASSVTWIAGSECTDCHRGRFKENESETFVKNQTDYRVFNVNAY